MPATTAPAGPISAPARDADRRPRADRPTLALLLVCTVQLLMVMDVTIVNISLPAIQADLGLSLTQSQWLVTAYAITFGGLLLAGGRIGDVLGRRRALVIGTLVFAAASAVAGSADHQVTLVGARALQGVGAALASPASLALIPAIYPRPEQRSRAMAVYAAMAGIGAVTGLVVGGTLTEVSSWRWVFLVGVPVAALVAASAPALLPRPDALRARLSVSSAFLATTAVAALVYAMTTAPSAGWGDDRTVTSLSVAAVAAIAFAALEARRSVPLLPRGHLRDLDKLTAWSVMSVVGGGMLGTLFLATHLLQADRGYGPLQAGISFVPTNLAMIAGSQVAVRLLARAGAWRLIALGASLSAAGALLLAAADGSDPYAAAMLPGLVLSGSGFGLMFVPVVIVAMRGAAPQEAGVISGLTSTMQQGGGAGGVAALVSIASTGQGAGRSVDPQRGFTVLVAAMVATALVATTAARRTRPPTA